jgi:selenocysteine lyase/cysteine desulfurase
VALAHVSNLLGEVVDVKALVDIVRAGPAGAQTRIAVDGVAYAPHLAMDVASWGVDWCGP